MGDIRKQKFATLFDGDEIDGKRYPIDAVVTGLDLLTAAFLQEQGRIEAVSDERAKILEKNLADKEAEEEAKAKVEKEAQEKADAEAKAEEEAKAAAEKEAKAKAEEEAKAKVGDVSANSGNQTPPPPPAATKP
jgi:septal ring factor EnvC (AmiA/AmiB activator)